MTLLSLVMIMWLVIILAAIFFEALFENLVAVWCAPAALIAFICGFFSISTRSQVLIFVIASICFIALSRLIKLILRLRDNHKASSKRIEF